MALHPSLFSEAGLSSSFAALPRSISVNAQLPFDVTSLTKAGSEVTSGWLDFEILGSTVTSTLTGMESQSPGDTVVVPFPLGVSTVACNGLLQALGGVGFACVDCDIAKDGSIPFNTTLPSGGNLMENTLFIFSSLDPTTRHNLTIVNGGPQSTSLALTQLLFEFSATSTGSSTISASRPTTPVALVPSIPLPSTLSVVPSQSSSTDDSPSGLTSQQIASAVIVAVLGSLALALCIVVIYVTRMRRTRRQPPALPSTPPGDAVRATALTSSTPSMTAANDARSTSLLSPRPLPPLPMPVSSSRPSIPPNPPPKSLRRQEPAPEPRRASQPTLPRDRRSALSVPATIRRRLSEIPASIPALWRQSPPRRRSSSTDLMLPDAEQQAESDDEHEHESIPRTSSPSAYSVMTDAEMGISPVEMSKHSSSNGSTIDIEVLRRGFPMPPTAPAGARLQRQGSAGDPVLPRRSAPPRMVTAPSEYSSGAGSAIGKGEDFESVRWSRDYLETPEGSSE